jgi:hypothetical protein
MVVCHSATDTTAHVFPCSDRNRVGGRVRWGDGSPTTDLFTRQGSCVPVAAPRCHGSYVWGHARRVPAHMHCMSRATAQVYTLQWVTYPWSPFATAICTISCKMRIQRRCHDAVTLQSRRCRCRDSGAYPEVRSRPRAPYSQLYAQKKNVKDATQICAKIRENIETRFKILITCPGPDKRTKCWLPFRGLQLKPSYVILGANYIKAYQCGGDTE